MKKLTSNKMARVQAQITIEFMFVIGVVMLIFFIFLGFSIDKKADLIKREVFLEKRSECQRIGDLITGVYAAGPGAQAKFNTNYIITIYNNSFLQVEEKANDTTVVENKIAVLASEAGETTLSFYNDVKTKLNPDWYRNCFSDISWSCPGWISDNIKWDLEDLMQNISYYNTIYLEDSHIQYNAMVNGKLYTDILNDWVKSGNVLILAEHFMCREQSSGSYGSTSYRCNPPDYKSDVWGILGETLHQEGGSYGNDVTIVREENGFDFDLGQSYDFEESSYITETANITVIGRYDSSSLPAISYWNYGNGRVYYFGDFQVQLSQSQYTNAITSLISKAYSLLIPIDESEITCSFYAKSPYYKLTGDLFIQNIDHKITITNATATA